MNYIAILSLVAFHALTVTALPPCVCTRNFRPVCGTDNNTYSNECLLKCQQHKSGTELSVQKDGPCGIPTQDTCICTLEYKPVCGNDGVTYPNKCTLLCKRSIIPDIYLVSEGACVPTASRCACTEEVDYVCGTDGNSYINTCVLNCSTEKDPKLGIKHKGKCDDSVRVAEPMLGDQPRGCVCPRNVKPVCGSDGVTYSNECLLRCAGEQVTVAKSAPC